MDGSRSAGAWGTSQGARQRHWQPKLRPSSDGEASLSEAPAAAATAPPGPVTPAEPSAADEAAAEGSAAAPPAPPPAPPPAAAVPPAIEEVRPGRPSDALDAARAEASEAGDQRTLHTLVAAASGCEPSSAEEGGNAIAQCVLAQVAYITGPFMHILVETGKSIYHLWNIVLRALATRMEAHLVAFQSTAAHLQEATLSGAVSAPHIAATTCTGTYENGSEIKSAVIQRAKDSSFQPACKVTAARGALLLGTGGGAAGGAAGLVVGSCLGAAACLAPAIFTLGLSIPLAAVIGSGVGLLTGAAAGTLAGAVGGSILGYGLHAKRDRATDARGQNMAQAQLANTPRLLPETPATLNQVQ